MTAWTGRGATGAAGLDDWKGSVAAGTGGRGGTGADTATRVVLQSQHIHAPEAFFAQITTPKTAEDALHDVADNKAVQAAVVDGAAIQCFNERNCYGGQLGRVPGLTLQIIEIRFREIRVRR